MNPALTDWMPLAPELFLTTMACVILIVDLFLKDSQRELSYVLAQVSLVGATVFTVRMGAEPQSVFTGLFVVDAFSQIIKMLLYLVVFMVLIYSKPYLQARGLFRGEYFVLMLFATIGMMIMASAGNLLSIYLGLELLALCQYALVGMHRDNTPASEAALKYFILGALASGMLLYGMSLLYGLTGSLDLAQINHLLSNTDSHDTTLVFALVFVMVGIAFKFGAAPFHMWIPDVYHGAPTAVTLFLSTAPKLAALAMTMRLLVDGFGAMQVDWQGICVVMAVLSILIGNVVAIAQTNLKRMLAYSTISHVGFLFLGLVGGGFNGLSSAMFYTVVYVLMSLGAFAVILLLSKEGFESEEINDFKGLARRHPWYAGMMGLLMFGMAGLPPTAGFYAKFMVLQAVVDAGYIWLAVYAVLLSVVGAFYYLRIIKVMFFDEPDSQERVRGDGVIEGVLTMNSLSVLLLGIFPGPLMSICVYAIQSFI